MLALGHEVFDAEGARFVRDRRLPDIWEANRVTAVTAASDAATIGCSRAPNVNTRSSATAASIWTPPRRQPSRPACCSTGTRPGNFS